MREYSASESEADRDNRPYWQIMDELEDRLLLRRRKWMRVISSAVIVVITAGLMVMLNSLGSV